MKIYIYNGFRQSFAGKVCKVGVIKLLINYPEKYFSQLLKLSTLQSFTFGSTINHQHPLKADSIEEAIETSVTK